MPLCRIAHRYYHGKSKRIVGKKTAASLGGNLKPLFVQLALEPLWALYAAAEAEAGGALQDGGKRTLAGMAQALGVAELLQQRDLKHPDRRVALQSVLRAWLPLSDTVLQMAVDCLPSPVAAAPLRLPYLRPTDAGSAGPSQAGRGPAASSSAVAADGGSEELPEGALEALAACDAGALACDASAKDTVVFVSKMIAVPSEMVPAGPGGPVAPASGCKEVFLAFGRVYGGTLRTGSVVSILQVSPCLESTLLTRLCVLHQPVASPSLSSVPTGLLDQDVSRRSKPS